MDLKDEDKCGVLLIVVKPPFCKSPPSLRLCNFLTSTGSKREPRPLPALLQRGAAREHASRVELRSRNLGKVDVSVYNDQTGPAEPQQFEK